MSDRLASVIAGAVRAGRARHGWTQAELASRLWPGCTKQVVYLIEKGTRPVALHEAPEVCAALGVSLSRLLIDAATPDRAALGL